MSGEADESDVKIMTFNIRSNGKYFNPVKVAKFILNQNPDIIVINEYNDSTANLLDSLLLKQYRHRTKKFEGKCTDLLYSKFPILKYYKLKKKKLQSLSYGSILKINDKSVCVFFCHLFSNNTDGWNMQKASSANSESGWKLSFTHYKNSQKHRKKEVDNICNYIDSVRSYPSFVVGDMNDFSYSETLRQFKENGFEDTWWRKGFGYGTTYKYKLCHLRIDHILYSHDIIPISVKVIDSGELSDHNALIGTFRIE